MQLNDSNNSLHVSSEQTTKSAIKIKMETGHIANTDARNKCTDF